MLWYSPCRAMNAIEMDVPSSSGSAAIVMGEDVEPQGCGKKRNGTVASAGAAGGEQLGSPDVRAALGDGER